MHLLDYIHCSITPQQDASTRRLSKLAALMIAFTAALAAAESSPAYIPISPDCK
jgi:hypothetical protein